MKRVLKYGLISLVFLTLFVYCYLAWPIWGIPFNAQRHGHPPLTPAWALECWLWEDDENTAAYNEELLKGYAQHDIPVRTLLIDSPWSLRYNDFEIDTLRFPKPEMWFRSLDSLGYRTVLWMTTMVDSYSKDTQIQHSAHWYNEAASKGFLTGNGSQIDWWKGTGGFIDYTNPRAMRWWTDMQKKVLDLGIDGWKLDGTATLFRRQIGPIPFFYQKSNAGWINTRQYMDLYYRTEYENGLKINPEFVTLSRAMDRNFHPEGFAPIDASPVNWVGDQKHYWKSKTDSGITTEKGKDVALDGIEGFESAIKNVLKSAKLGYNIIGSDVAGFSGKRIPPRLYIRWAQFSAFCGLFMNGGHGERALWKRSQQELDIIRKFSWLHTELVPYMYHYVVNANQGGRVLQLPVEGTYQYLFGDHLFVSPIYEDTLRREVRLPEGKWRYWFDDKQVINGPALIRRDFPLDQYPLYIKEGAIIPMNISRPYTGIGDSTTRDHLTWLIYPFEKSSFTIYDTKTQEPTTLQITQSNVEIELAFTGKSVPSIFKIHLNNSPKSVMMAGKLLTSEAYNFDDEKRKLTIRAKNPSGKIFRIML